MRISVIYDTVSVSCKRVVSVLSPLQMRIQDFFKEGVVSMRVQGKRPRAEEVREGKGKGNV